MKICLVGYVDNTPENQEMLDTYELRNDFWAENFKFRRRDGKPVSEEELKMVSKWIDREIVKKHRTNWLSNRETPYIDVKDPVLIKKYYPFMSDDEIKEQLEAERRAEEMDAIRNLPYEEWKQRVLAMPASPNSLPSYHPTSTNVAKQLEFEFVD
jgi:hypothetical protein